MEDREMITAAIDDFITAYNSGDLARVLAYYSDDLIKSRHGAAAESKSETADRLVSVFAGFYSKVDATVEEVEVSGNLAYTRGELRVTLTPKSGGEAQTIERRYLEIWRKENGQW